MSTAARLLCSMMIVFAASSALADPVADFYRGKTVYIMINGSIGGEYDTQARLIARHLAKHLPGDPTIVPQNMASADGLVVANYLYNAAPKNGTVLGTMQNNLPALQVVGGQGVKFDAGKFSWIGSVAPQTETMGVWAATGVRTIEDARRRELLAGAVSAGSMTYFLPTMLDQLLGARFKVVLGYMGQGDINLAIERGEVQARENTWSGWKMAKPEWLSDKKIIILVQAGPKAPDLPGVPSIDDLAKTQQDKMIIDLAMSGTQLGRPLVAPPGVPNERVEALRKAFMETVRDPAFLADAAAARVDVNPVSGNRLQRIVERLLTTPKDLAGRAKRFLE